MDARHECEAGLFCSQRHRVPLSPAGRRQNVVEHLYTVLRDSLLQCQLTTEALVDKYDEIFRRWVPVIDGGRLRQDLKKCNDNQARPLELSLLLLAMLLLVNPIVKHDRAERLTLSANTLYNITKTNLALAPTFSASTSLRLVQAGILLTVREYTSLRPKTAYVTLINCVGLFRVATQDQHSASVPEERNIAWAFPMLERMFLCEIADNRAPVTQCPPPDIEAPIDFLGSVTSSGGHPPPIQVLSDIFARQANLSVMIEQAHTTITSKETTNSKAAKLAILDDQLRRTLGMLMRAIGQKYLWNCILVAQCVRLLFVLHNSVLAVLDGSAEYSGPIPATGLDAAGELKARSLSSHLALDMAVRMVIDVLDLVPPDNDHPMPMVGIYNVIAAKTWLRRRTEIGLAPDPENVGTGRDVAKVLDEAEQAYRRRWCLGL
jgi:hypothetical protein